MNKKNTITLAERLMFVNTVVKFSKNEGTYEPALYDYAFRMATVIFFTDANVENMEQDEMENLAFSKEVTDMMREIPRKFVLETLNKACREKISMEREQWMAAYNGLIQNEPWNKITESITGFVNDFSKQFNTDEFARAILENIHNGVEMEAPDTSSEK